MNITYFVQLYGDSLEQCQWLRFNEKTPAGTVSTGHFEEAVKQAEDQRLVVLVPSTDVSLKQVTLKSKNRKQIASAVPFIIEDEVAADIDELHFAVQTLDKSLGQHLVAVVSKDLMQSIFEVIDAHAFQAVSVVPQTLIVPFSEPNWTLFSQVDVTTLRTGDHEGYGVDPQNRDVVVSLAIDRYLQEEETLPELLLYNYSETAVNFDGVVNSVSGGATDALSLMGRYWLDHQGTLNLLQGDFRIERELPLHAMEWRIAVSLIGISVLLVLLSMAIDNYRYMQQNAQLDYKMQQLYEDIFGENSQSPASDMRKQMIALQGDSSGTVSPFLQHVGNSGQQLIKQSSSTVSRMRFNGEELELDLETDSIEKLESLQKLIDNQATQAELKAVSSDKGKIRARLVISDGAPS